jgi:uncharacterized protein YprB with RNaseH-like and TPR domain
VSLRSKLSRLALPGSPGAFAVEAVPEEAQLQPQPQPPPLEPPNRDRADTLGDLRARMQAVLERTARRAPPPPPPVDTTELPFITEETPLGPLSIRSQRLSAAHRMGRAPLTPARDASTELLALLALDPTLAACDPRRALFLDTETTGLSGGTGTVAFLVGLAFWEPGEGGLTVEQVLVRNLGEEAPMLEHVARRIRDASMLVTFNGKSFDMPLLRTRFVMARLDAPTEPPHLDLVHVARRLHRPRLETARHAGREVWSCRLTTIEREVLGFERHDDVPSGEVSQCYLHFLRTGEARLLLGVIEHNAWDVVAMAALMGLYGEPLAGSQLEADDLVGVARVLKRAGAVEHAFEVVNRAVEAGAGHESLRARAEIAKARGDRVMALADFEQLANAVDDPRVRLELAKLYEHFVREPARALAVVERGTSEAPAPSARRAHRLAAKAAKFETALRSAQTELPGLTLAAIRASGAGRTRKRAARRDP